MAASHRVCVHIGAPKTGSTWLQKTLVENRPALLARGVLYPNVSLRGHGHHDLAFLLAGAYPEWATSQPRTLAELEADLAAVVRDYSGTVLLSSENLYLFPHPANFRELLKRTGLADDVTIIVYVRRQDDAHESWYNQTIKAQGCTHEIDECVYRFFGLWDYSEQLAKWSSVFGRDALRVMPYELEQTLGGTLLRDFGLTAGFETADLQVAEAFVNSGLNRDLLEFQKQVNRLALTPLQKRRHHSELIALSAHSAGKGVFDEAPLLGPAKRREILAAYAEGNRLVAETYLGRADLFMAKSPAADVAALLPSSGLTPEKRAVIEEWLREKGVASVWLTVPAPCTHPSTLRKKWPLKISGSR